jgi:hypothetical protein
VLLILGDQIVDAEDKKIFDGDFEGVTRRATSRRYAPFVGA